MRKGGVGEYFILFVINIVTCVIQFPYDGSRPSSSRLVFESYKDCVPMNL